MNKDQKDKDTHHQTQGIEARECALMVIHQVFEQEAYTSIALDRSLKASHLSMQDRTLVTEIVNGTIRMSKHLDWVLNLFLKKPVQKINPWVRDILRLSLYQLLFLDKIPAHAAVNSAVILTRKKVGKTMAGLVNGVLRNYLRNKDKIEYPDPADSVLYLSVYYSQPEWIVEMLIKQFGLRQCQSVLEYFNEAPHVTLRTNVLKMERNALLEALKTDHIEALPGRNLPWSIDLNAIHMDIESLPLYKQGCFYIQNEAAMLAASILDPQPEERILDLCSGLGGKATHFAEYMHDKGHVYAFELYEHKINLIQHNCKRLGINSVKSSQGDILDMDLPGSFDRVFLDAPCSGLGVLNRRADSRWRKQTADIVQLSQLQYTMLQKAGQSVRRGGILVYCTCTVCPSENEEVIQKFMKNEADFVLDDISSALSFLPLDQSDLNLAQSGMLTIVPGKYATDGMFYAKLRRL